MYQTYTQTDSMNNPELHWKILTQNETISFYIFKAKKKAACLSMYQTYTQADSMKTQKFIGNFGSK